MVDPTGQDAQCPHCNERHGYYMDTDIYGTYMRCLTCGVTVP